MVLSVTVSGHVLSPALDDYIAEFHEWSRQAATAAFEELEKSQKAVRRKLVRAG